MYWLRDFTICRILVGLLSLTVLMTKASTSTSTGQNKKFQRFDKYHDNEPAQNELGIFPCWLSMTRARGVSYTTTIMVVNKKFLSKEDIEEYKSICKGNATFIGTDYLGLDVRTEDCTVTDTAVIHILTLSPGPEEKDFYDYNVTHKQVIVKPFIDKDTGATCILGGGLGRKFYASIRQGRFPNDSSTTATVDKDIFLLEDIGTQALEFFEDAIDPQVIYQGTDLLGSRKYKCVMEILRGSLATVEKLQSVCEFDCSSSTSTSNSKKQQQEKKKKTEL